MLWIVFLVNHYMVLKDSKAYAKKAVQYLKQAYQRKFDDYVVLCYLGSAYNLLAKDTWNSFDKLSHVNKGIECMDKAIRKDPNNITMRTIRANNSWPRVKNTKGWFATLEKEESYGSHRNAKHKERLLLG